MVLAYILPMAFSAAEEFLDYLGVDYDRAVVNVHRLHILKRFRQYMGPLGAPSGLSDEGLRAYYRDLLVRAHEDFVHSSPGRRRPNTFRPITPHRATWRSTSCSACSRSNPPSKPNCWTRRRCSARPTEIFT
jgi:hypothetical protein